MPEATITNPSAAFQTVSDHTTGRIDSGGHVQYPQEVVELRADAAITKGQAVCTVVPTTTVELSVTPMTAAITAADPWRFLGAALADAAAGDKVLVCTWGVCEAHFDAASTAAALSLLALPATTTGEFDIAADPVDNGLYAGYCLGAEINSEDKVLAFIGQPLVRFEAGA